MASLSLGFSTLTPEMQVMNVNSWDDIHPTKPNRGHRDSFGSVFLGSFENTQDSGNGHGEGHIGQFG